MKQYQLYQNGKWLPTPDSIDVIDPLTGAAFAKVPAMKKEDIDVSLAGSRAAFKAWSALDPARRVAYMESFAKLLEAEVESVAQTLSREVCKRISDARTEVKRTVEYVRRTNEEYLKMVANPLRYSPEDLGVAGKRATFLRVPLGVVLAIAPFNYPVNLALAKIAPALVTGNCVAFKPATQAAVTGIELARLFDKAGFPAGVFNMVSGRGRDIGDYVVAHREVDMISFTGSTPVGKSIARLAHGKPLVLELGGKDFAIVRADADLPKAASDIVKGAFSYSGQRCTAIKRVLADRAVVAELTALLSKETAALTVGAPLDDAFVTPVIDLRSADYVQGLVDEAVKLGARVVVGGKRDKNLLWPTLVADVTPDMKLAWDEPFGPVLPVIAVESDERAVALANLSQYGLQGSIFTRDVARAERMALDLDTGSVNVNGPSSRGPDIMPFIGVKDSGFGVQGIVESMFSMTRYKGIVVNF